MLRTHARSSQLLDVARVLPPRRGSRMKLSLLFVAAGAVTVNAQPATPIHDPLATTERWGGGLRLTGASGIGALPGRNLGAEVAVNVRHDELFGELAMSHWQAEGDYRVMSSAGPSVPLGL